LTNDPSLPNDIATSDIAPITEARDGADNIAYSARLHEPPATVFCGILGISDYLARFTAPAAGDRAITTQ
jgi:hypothetical protein